MAAWVIWDGQPGRICDWAVSREAGKQNGGKQVEWDGPSGGERRARLAIVLAGMVDGVLSVSK
jgi:hypothetical protein